MLVSRVWACLWNGFLDVARTSCCILDVAFVCRVRVNVERLELIVMSRFGVVVLAMRCLLTISDLPPVSVSAALVVSAVSAVCSLVVFATVPSIML